MPALVPVERPTWEEEAWVGVEVVRRPWVEVGAVVEVVVDEVVGSGGGEVLEGFRRLGDCQFDSTCEGRKASLSMTCMTPFATIKSDSMTFAALMYVSPS